MNYGSAEIRNTMWVFFVVLLIAGLGSSLSAYALGWLTMVVGVGLLGLNVWRYWDLSGSEEEEDVKGLRLGFVLSSLFVVIGVIVVIAPIEVPISVIRFVVGYVLLASGFVFGNMLAEYLADYLS